MHISYDQFKLFMLCNCIHISYIVIYKSNNSIVKKLSVVEVLQWNNSKLLSTDFLETHLTEKDEESLFYPCYSEFPEKCSNLGTSRIIQQIDEVIEEKGKQE